MSDNNCEHCTCASVQNTEISSTSAVDEVTYDQLLESLLSVKKLLRAAIYPATFHVNFECLLTHLSESGLTVPYRPPSKALVTSVCTFVRILNDNHHILAGTITSTRRGLQELASVLEDAAV